MGVLTHPVKCLRDGIGASRLQCPPRPSKSKGKWNVRINYRGQILPEPQEASDIPRLFPELAAEIRRSVEVQERARLQRERDAEDQRLHDWFCDVGRA